jgi:uncharacterized metal-binding protein
MDGTIEAYFFRENVKVLRFNALIENKGYMYKFKEDHPTPYNSTQKT